MYHRAGDDVSNQLALFERVRGFVQIVDDGLFSPVPSRQGTLALLESLINVEEMAQEDIGGVSTRHYQGWIDTDSIFDEVLTNLDASMPGYETALRNFDLQRQVTLDVELWMGASDGWIHQLTIDARAPMVGPLGEGLEIIGWMTFHTEAGYFGFDEPVAFDEPVTSSGELEPGWTLIGSSSGDSPAPSVALERVIGE